MNARVATRATVLALLVYICHRNGNAKLLTTPLDTEVKVNDSVYLNCSTSNSSLEIHWYRNDKHVYAGGKFYSPYHERFQMKKSGIGEYNLFIPSVKPEDAGRYECRDMEGSGLSHSVELIVLAADPVCSSNMKSDGVVGSNTCNVKPEEVQFSCSVSFYGQPPQMEWSPLRNQNPLYNVSCETNDRRLTCNLTMAADQKLDGFSFVCHTTRATSEQYECTTEALKITYFTRNVVVMEKALNDKVACSVNSSLHSYNVAWKLTNGDGELTVANNQTHVLNASGLYRCEVEYSIRNANCLDVVAFFYVTKPSPIVGKGTECSETCSVYMGLMVAFILAFVATNVIWLIYIVQLKRKSKRRPKGREDIELLSRGTTDELARMNTDLELYNTKNRELEQQIELLTKDLELHEKKIEDLAEKHGKQRLEWQEEKKILLQRQLETDQLLFRNRIGQINYLQEPTLIGAIVSETNATKGDDRIYGLAILDNEIFTVRRLATEFQVFGLTDYNFIRTCSVKEMQNPRNIVSCSNRKRLYILDWKYGGMPKEILAVDVKGNLLKDEKWLIADDCGHMSVTSESSVILPLPKRMLLTEYTSDGQLLRQIQISAESGIMNPLHAIKLSSGHFVVSHGDFGEVEHRVCVIDTTGNLIKAFGDRKGWTDSQMDVPGYLAVDGDGNILVVDRNNRRVLLLNSSLEFQRELLCCMKYKLRYPWRVCLDSTQGRLLVADNAFKSENGKFVDGQVLVFSVYKMSGIASPIKELMS